MSSTFAIDPKDLNQVEVDNLHSIGGKIIGVFQAIATIVMIGVLLFDGIKLMFGAVNEKAMIKEKAIPFLIGSVVVFSATSLVSIIYNLVGVHPISATQDLLLKLMKNFKEQQIILKM